MDKAESGLTVYFEGPFWVGVFQRREAGTLSAAKVTFGAEPKDQEVYALILREYDRLEFGPAVPDEERKAAVMSPKRAQREARRLTQGSGTGTKAQQALQLQREQAGLERKGRRRERIREEKQRRFDQKQEKKREKHRGH